jgi:hypothetical protein
MNNVSLRSRLTRSWLAVICLALLGYLTVSLRAGTLAAASCGRTDVQSAINIAKPGDTVVIPAGTCTWTAQVLVSEKAITLQGAGVGQTIIRNGYSSGAMLAFHFRAGQATTFLTGITFDAARLDTGSNPVVSLSGGGTNQFRLHHFSMTNLLERGIAIDMDGREMSGVVDHCTMEMPVTSGGSKAISIFGAGGGDHTPFSRPLALGTNTYIFIEDCTFTFGGPNDGALDAYNGARYVFRHNVVTNTNVSHHGADSGGYRSTHSFEIYNNSFSSSVRDRMHYFRGGTGVVFNNSYTGNYSTFEITNYRSDESHAPWGQCNGSSSWDGNAESNGYPCLDQIGVVFDANGGQGYAFQPLYEWGNTLNGVDLDARVAQHNASIHIKQGRDFFNDMVRPGYTPYIYPHPLVTGGSTQPPAAPSNLRIIR